MFSILRYTGWQIKLLFRYQILTAAFIIAAFYLVLLYFIPFLQNDIAAITIIFLDPTGIGFIFIGVFILFEKGDNTLEAQSVTPMQTWHYLWAKALALLLPAVICSLAIAITVKGMHFQIIPFLISLVLSSLIFSFLGIAGVMRVDTFNQYMILIPLFLAPTSVPLINFFGFTDWKVLALIPTHSTLDLLAGSFSGNFHLRQLLDIAYLAIWTFGSYYFARREFEKKMYQ